MSPLPGTLYTGDCLAVMRRWPAACVDHALLDPPYNLSRRRGLGWAFSSHVTMAEAWDRRPREQYLAFCRAWLGEVCRVVKPNGNLFLFGSFHSVFDLGHLLNEAGVKVLNSIIWMKPNAQPNITCRSLTESTEQILWACNAPARKATGWVFDYDAAKQLNGGKQLRNVWSIPTTPPRERTHGKHPTQKPLELIQRLLLIGTRPGDLVLDCFAGTGTTGVAAANLGRRYVLVEQNAEYAAIARAHLAALPGGTPGAAARE